MRLLPIASTTALLATNLFAQSDLQWRQITPTNSPAQRDGHEMVWDAARQQLVLFGGYNGSYLGDTWTFDGVDWQQFTPMTSPPPRRNHAMAFDPLRGRVVLIGGENGPTTFRDTWEWDGTTWTQVASGTNGVRAGGAACFDPRLGGIVYASQFDTKLWDGSSWSTLFLNNPPPYAVDNLQIVYHPVDGVIGLHEHWLMRFTPQTGWDVIYEEWEYFWRRRAATAFDPTSATMLIHGGSGGLGGSSASASHDTWAWEGDAFSLVTAFGPPGSEDGQLVFDPTREVFVLFGGRGYSSGQYRGETWELFSEPVAAAYETFGSGCAGSSVFQPTLQPELAINAAPRLGGTFTVRADGLPPNAAFGIFGTSDEVWSGQALPLDLGVIGMSGCSAYVNHVFVTALPGTASTRHWTLTIPDRASLLGFEFFQQIVAVAPGANPLDLVWSNGGAGTIGNF